MRKSKFYGGNKTVEKMLFMRKVEEMIPKVYASIACELYELGWTPQEIEDLFYASQLRWEDSIKNGWDMLENVHEVTGMDVAYFRETGNIVDK